MSEAEATVAAARIAASAARYAGWTQGLLTALAGSLTIVAAFIAYRGSVRQVAIAEKKHQTRTSALLFRLKAAIADVAKEARQLGEAVAVKKANGGAYDSINPFSLNNIFVPSILNEENWEGHSLFGQDFVEKISDLQRAFSEYTTLAVMVLSENLCAAHPSPTAGVEIEFNEDGGIDMFQLTVLEHFELTLSKVKKAAVITHPPKEDRIWSRKGW